MENLFDTWKFRQRELKLLLQPAIYIMTRLYMLPDYETWESECRDNTTTCRGSCETVQTLTSVQIAATVTIKS